MASEIEYAENAWRAKYREYTLAWEEYRELCDVAGQCLQVGCRQSRMPNSHFCQEHDADAEYPDCW